MKFAGYVTVRLNSKRVPFKSIQKIKGEPLVKYAIATLNKVDGLSDILLYCSEKNIRKYVGSHLSYTFIERPKRLDADSTTFNDILESIIDKIDADYIVFLSCTSPFIKAKTIQEMMKQIESNNFDSAFTVFNKRSFGWFKNRPLNYDPSNVPKTQDLEPILLETSGLYIFSKSLFKKHKRRIGFKPYIKVIDIFEGWDIDYPEDLKMARLMAQGTKITKLIDFWELNPKFNEIFRKTTARSGNPKERCYILYQLLKNTNNLEGDIVEVGVYRGRSAKVIALASPNRNVYLFDTFTGMPEVDSMRDNFYQKGAFSNTSLDEVRKFLSECKNVTIYVGFFPDTAKPIAEKTFSFVHIDVDIYKSYIDCCKFFYPRMVEGGIMLFDDVGFIDCAGAKIALDEFFSDKEEFPIYLATGQAFVIKRGKK